MKKIISSLVLLAVFVLAACTKQGEPQGNITVNLKPGQRTSCSDPGVGSNGSAAYGTHFRNWLNANGYSDLASTEGWGGSGNGDCLAVYQPVLFIHGNGGYAQDWSRVRSDFLDYGYYPSELYAIGYGLKGSSNTSENYHKASYMQTIRRMIAAMKAYTGKSKVDVIGHSLGVTLARKAIKGGTAYNTYDRSGSSTNLGSSISSSVDTFVGIAGANRGLLSCGWWDNGTAVWTKACWSNGLSVDNPFIDDLGWGGNEGSYTFSILSWVDEVICSTGTCYVWYKHSSSINGQDGSKQYYSAPYGHFGVKNYTSSVQISMVLNHTY